VGDHLSLRGTRAGRYDASPRTGRGDVPRPVAVDWDVLWLLLLSVLELAVVAMLGHVLPTYLFGRPVWSVTILASGVLFVAVYPLPAVLEAGAYPTWDYGSVLLLLIYLVLPLVVFTTFVRVLVPALRPAGLRMSSAD